ncbi:MAG: NTP transferase domain-containing protein [Methanobacteriota archaeon]|nr:MAG: NTP transferase domain-containing protein [Euryarchaeota archaeon]
MAGGRATRFNTKVEKALLEVGQRTLLERALDSLKVEEVSEVFVAASPFTPCTTAKAKELGIGIIATPGAGYHEDIAQLLTSYDSFLTLNIDVPFVRKTHVVRFLRAFDGRSLAAVLPISATNGKTNRKSLARDEAGGRFVWVGLNIVTAEPETITLEYDDPLLAININDESDLARANEIAVEMGL